MSLLELRNVSMGYTSGATRTEVLAGINLTIDEGEFVVIVGFSGSGKTTLVNLIAGLSTPERGEVVLRGAPIRGAGPDRGVVFQNYSLLPWLSVRENVALAVDAVHGALPASERADMVERHVATVNLSAAIDKKPTELSGGMRQRVAVARALAMNPQVLLLDEPLSALDALTRASLQDELARICAGGSTTILLITNDVEEALLLGDRIIPLSAGPSARLGPSFAVDLPRPRDRRALARDPRARELRTQIVDYLLASARAGRRRREQAAAVVTGDALELA
jgi:nitrate/nitrite transport system ATP-binding protein